AWVTTSAAASKSTAMSTPGLRTTSAPKYVRPAPSSRALFVSPPYPTPNSRQGAAIRPLLSVSSTYAASSRVINNHLEPLGSSRPVTADGLYRAESRGCARSRRRTQRARASRLHRASSQRDSQRAADQIRHDRQVEVRDPLDHAPTERHEAGEGEGAGPAALGVAIPAQE